MMASYESDFDAALGRGRIYDSAEQLRATPEGTPITDAQGRHWIRGFNDPAERRWRRRKAPRLIWVGIGGHHDRCPSSEILLPATHASTEDFWPTTLVEGSGTPISIGSIAGGCVGGNPGLSLWNEAEARARDLFSGAGKSNTDGGGRNQVDPTGWMYGSGTMTVQNAHSADYLSTPIAAIPANLANLFTATSGNETGGNSSASS
ncbi:hypothetical protein EEB12_28305 [Rhodococcus sp. WS1]|uniref:hypothetical protein n=2 Tax=unclassified Rhodococcus (in: high G+C Gram-positive bacteria) TaxID=192944 RepID=UPI00116F98A5|nr:hypothetical protein [Rhodococcus sp. WS7]ROZ52763.1 hypothetical protein EEB12_28305 [Rhodococcus sp. WS1]